MMDTELQKKNNTNKTADEDVNVILGTLMKYIAPEKSNTSKAPDEETPSPKQSCKKRFKENYCTKKFWLDATKRRFPILVWLPRYDWRHNIVSDLSAGFTLACINVPQGLSFALLARAPLISGIYTTCFSSFAYALLGTAVISAFGPVAVSSMLTGEAVALYMRSKNFTALPDGTAQDEEVRATYISTLTFVIGLIYFVLFLLQLSVIRALFIKAFVCGFIMGCCVHIIIQTLKMLINVKVKIRYGFFMVIYNLRDLILSLPQTHIPTLILSLVVSLILLLNTFVLKKLVAKVTSFILPMEGLVLVGSILVSYFLEFQKNGFDVVGHIPKGVPAITPLDPSLLQITFPRAATISFINLAITLSMVIAFNPGKADANQELFAMSAANMICSNLQCLTIGNSMMRTIVAINLGIKSQLATMFSSTILLFVILFAGPLFEPLPIAVLGCIIITSTGQLFVTSCAGIPSLFRISMEDGLIWLAVFCITTIVDINSGLIVGCVLSLRKFLMRVIHEQDAEEAKKEQEANDRSKKEEEAKESDIPSKEILLERRRGSIVQY